MGEGGEACEGVADIGVGEKKDKEYDAPHATRMAVEEGFRPGGGVVLLKTPLHSLPTVLEELHLQTPCPSPHPTSINTSASPSSCEPLLPCSYDPPSRGRGVR